MSEDPAHYDADRHAIFSRRQLRASPASRRFDDPEYRPPTPEEVRSLLHLARWSPRDAARRLGVDTDPDAGIRRVESWCARRDDDGHRSIPYAAWRLGLIEAGLVEPVVPSAPPT